MLMETGVKPIIAVAIPYCVDIGTTNHYKQLKVIVLVFLVNLILS